MCTSVEFNVCACYTYTGCSAAAYTCGSDVWFCSTLVFKFTPKTETSVQFYALKILYLNEK